MIPPPADAVCAARMEEVLETNECRWVRAHPVACMDGPSPQRAQETREPRALVGRHATGEGITVPPDPVPLPAEALQYPSRRRIGDVGTLRDDIATWSADRNTRHPGGDWRMKVDDGRASQLTQESRFANALGREGVYDPAQIRRCAILLGHLPCLGGLQPQRLKAGPW